MSLTGKLTICGEGDIVDVYETWEVDDGCSSRWTYISEFWIYNSFGDMELDVLLAIDDSNGCFDPSEPLTYLFYVDLLNQSTLLKQPSDPISPFRSRILSLYPTMTPRDNTIPRRVPIAGKA